MPTSVRTGSRSSAATAQPNLPSATPTAPYDPLAPPPAGAFVFYACGGPVDGTHRDWGHVGLALGDGRVVHAWDEVRVDDARDVEDLRPAAGWTAPRLIGWAPRNGSSRAIARATGLDG